MPDNDSRAVKSSIFDGSTRPRASSDGGNTSSDAGDPAAATAGTSDDTGSGEVGHRADALAGTIMAERSVLPRPVVRWRKGHGNPGKRCASKSRSATWVQWSRPTRCHLSATDRNGCRSFPQNCPCFPGMRTLRPSSSSHRVPHEWALRHIPSGSKRRRKLIRTKAPLPNSTSRSIRSMNPF